MACAFCDIVNYRAPATIVHEWDDAIAILPLNPVVPGHILVLPREHVETFFSSPDVSAATMRRTAELLHGVERHIDSNDYNVITSAGSAATQTVMHLHVHLVPRRPDDGLALPWTKREAGQRTAMAVPKRWWRYAVLRGTDIPLDLNGKWFDLDEMRETLPRAGPSGQFVPTNMFEVREDGTPAVVYRLAWRR